MGFCMAKGKSNDYRVILHDIRSAHNVGSMFRTADASGISRMYLSGTTPAPVDRFGRTSKEIAKTALGAEDSVPWEKVDSVIRLITALKKEGFTIIGIEQDARAVDHKKVRAGKKAVFLVGNEVEGMDKKILARCDTVAEIPMAGSKESLNVAVAFGVALFRILKI